ncbi:MAG: proline--tRNA ligase [candidate division Zixibacteria bacterium]|nr:proline--tRNA ligase [candidate division Zixibacteria bacterium]
MQWTKSYIPTLREDPAEAELISHKLLMRAGFIRKVTAGIYNYLPLMQRVLLKITQIVREEMDNAGALEITMPVLHPSELWIASGRWDVVGKEQMRLKDRHMRDLCLGGTHEEVVTDLVAGELKSYRQLPKNLYQIQVKFRDEIRPRFGLMRGREFIMKDAYSFDVDEAGLDESYKIMVDAYFKVFERCGFDIRKVEGDTGAMGGTGAHEFMVIVDTEGGEGIIYYCDECDYAATDEKASFRGNLKTDSSASPQELELVHTPNMKTVEEVTAFLKVPATKLVKTLLYLADGEPVAALIRGDRTINEVKLKNNLACNQLEMADADTVKRLTGADVGFAGPHGLSGVNFVVDNEVSVMNNFVVGANKDDHHFINVNHPRDFKFEQTTDLKMAEVGEKCPRCENGTLHSHRGIEVGNTFKLGTKYSSSIGAKFIDEDNQEKPIIMGSYGIGITRTAQAAVERYHDENGIIWPKPIAPYDIEIIYTNSSDENQKRIAFDLYNRLQKDGKTVLIDDRDERAGVKFKDADLIGIPVRVVIGERGIKEGIAEVKLRATGEVSKVSLEDAAEKVVEIHDNIS